VHIRALLFDLDDTLLPDRGNFEACLRQACTQVPGADAAALAETVRVRARELWRAAPDWDFGNRLGISSWEALASDFPGDQPAMPRLRAWAPHFRREAWQAALDEHGVRADPQELNAEFVRRRQETRRLFDDALLALQTAAAHYPLALVTNGPADIQHGKIEAIGIAHFFSAVVISGELGAGKPHPEPFEAALRQLRVDPSQAVMIGDSLERDVAGATALGLSAILLNRDSFYRHDPGVPKMSSLAELPRVLAALARLDTMSPTAQR